MGKIKVVNIKWDTDGEIIKDLPTEVEIEDNPDLEIADILSDKYGFCVESYNVNDSRK